ncbi:S66 family peptidase [Falsibacillus pallidus]|uniref:Muramoyltetrapeptide carboxypeptidase LdcA involved in peptidoglycan recycling n=1 Tax=Falsibacillus pallidus TaxID=493781 RepID=A0A370GPX6_9BACI|nr:S66 peptidase family protein [Falsibacillus pallidus]RDI45737.1 muramoyltetrapeptide carboxypeptidase LdcA involved in peptidoglycan recycling [Falsibacillus pallidus]
MITYPLLKANTVIGITAPSSGVPEELHSLVKQACSKLENEGFNTIIGDTVWKQEKAKSSPATKRAAEFMEMMQEDAVGLIIPPWGGELLIEIIEKLDFDNINPKWILGYSDTSVLLLAITLKTGIATAHGVNLIDMRGEYTDETTVMWHKVLTTEKDGMVVQASSSFYQHKWDHENPSPCVFHLTEKTEWKTVSEKEEHFKGRLLGGCIDVIRHLIGTPYGEVAAFRDQHINGENVIWYLENCEMNTTDLRRSLIQMKLAGWFENTSGILFGRSSANQPVNGYTAEDIYQELADEFGIPIIYDVDCGHVPPQITFVNGAYAEVEVKDGKGKIVQHFKS